MNKLKKKENFVVICVCAILLFAFIAFHAAMWAVAFSSSRKDMDIDRIRANGLGTSYGFATLTFAGDAPIVAGSTSAVQTNLYIVESCQISNDTIAATTTAAAPYCKVQEQAGTQRGTILIGNVASGTVKVNWTAWGRQGVTR